MTDVNLTELARLHGMHRYTAYRWFQNGKLPVPVVRVNARSVLAAPDAVLGPARGGLGKSARVSSHDQKACLGPQVACLTGWAAQSGRGVVRAEAAAGSGTSGQARRLLVSQDVQTVVAGHRDRHGRMSTQLAGAARSWHGRGLVVPGPDAADGDLVRDVAQVLASCCVRAYGRRPARNRAGKARRAVRDVGPASPRAAR
jgi:putative resolvase